MTIDPVFKNIISIDERGVPILAGTKIKVIEIVAAMIFFGARNLRTLYPDCSSRQIFSAIAYFNRWREELREELANLLRALDAVALWRKIGYL